MFTKISAYLLILIIYVDISLMFTKISAYLNNIC